MEAAKRQAKEEELAAMQETLTAAEASVASTQASLEAEAGKRQAKEEELAAMQEMLTAAEASVASTQASLEAEAGKRQAKEEELAAMQETLTSMDLPNLPSGAVQQAGSVTEVEAKEEIIKLQMLLAEKSKTAEDAVAQVAALQKEMDDMKPHERLRLDPSSVQHKLDDGDNRSQAKSEPADNTELAYSEVRVAVEVSDEGNCAAGNVCLDSVSDSSVFDDSPFDSAAIDQNPSRHTLATIAVSLSGESGAAVLSPESPSGLSFDSASSPEKPTSSLVPSKLVSMSSVLDDEKLEILESLESADGSTSSAVQLGFVGGRQVDAEVERDVLDCAARHAEGRFKRNYEKELTIKLAGYVINS